MGYLNIFKEIAQKDDISIPTVVLFLSTAKIHLRGVEQSTTLTAGSRFGLL